MSSRRGGFGLRLAIAAVLWVALPADPAAAQEPRALTLDSVQVVYWPGEEGVARRTLQAATSPILFPGIGRVRGLAAGTIILAPSEAIFDSVTGGRAPHWSAGVAIPAQRTIVLPAFSSPRTGRQDPLTALRHELAHLALHAHLQAEIPRWFNEGYATWASGEFDASAGWQIRLALLRGVLPPLDSLTLSWPEGAADARLAYLLAASAVQFLATRGSDQAFTAFLATWRDQGNLHIALRTVYLTTLDRFEGDWRAMIRRRYGWLLAVAQIGFFWVFLTFFFLALGMLRRRRSREKMEQMRAEDRLSVPADGEAVAAREAEWWADTPEGPTAADLERMAADAREAERPGREEGPKPGGPLDAESPPGPSTPGEHPPRVDEEPRQG